MTTTTKLTPNKEALKHATFNLWQVIAIASIALHVIILGDSKIAHFFDGSHTERWLAVRTIGFEGGMFFQQVEPVGSEPLQAKWVATISKKNGVDRRVCGGLGGLGTYKQRSEPIYMTPSDWAGDECILHAGAEYVATASWQWLDGQGHSRTTSSVFSFTYKEAE